MWYVCDVLYAVLYVRVSCFVVRGCAVSRRYINVCNCDMFSVDDVYLDHLSSVLCVLMVEGMSVVVIVMLSLMSVMSPPPAVCHLSARTVVKLCVCFRDELGFLNCYDICRCVVNKQFELLEFVFDSVYVDLQYDEIFLTFSAGSVSLCCVCGCCCLPTPMTLASGGSPMFPHVVHQPASPSIWPAVQSLRRGLSTNPGVTMWCVCGCS